MPIDEYLSKVRLISLSHRNATTITLSKAYLDLDNTYRVLLNSYKEAYILQTCNRVEVYYYGNDDSVAEGLYGSRGLLKYAVKLRGIDTVRHIFRVASGLESASIGESEILGQVEEAFNDARRRGALGGLLGFTVDRAIRVGKEVRSRFPELSTGPVGVGSLVAEYIIRLRNRGLRIAIVGAGSMGSDIARRLFEKGFRNVVIVNRTVEKAKNLALRYGYSYMPLDSIANVIKSSDVVVFATSSPKPLVRPSDLNGYADKVLLIDIGVPRNTDPEIPNVVTIDELKGLENELIVSKRRAVEEASRFIEDKLTEFTKLFARRIIEIEIGELVKWGMEISKGEVSRALKARIIDNEEGALVAAQSAVKRVMSPIIEYVKYLSENGRLDEALRLIEGIKSRIR